MASLHYINSGARQQLERVVGSQQTGRQNKALRQKEAEKNHLEILKTFQGLRGTRSKSILVVTKTLLVPLGLTPLFMLMLD